MSRSLLTLICFQYVHFLKEFHQDYVDSPDISSDSFPERQFIFQDSCPLILLLF